MPLHVKLVKLNIFRKFKSSWLNGPIRNLNAFFLFEGWLAAGSPARSSATYSAGVLPIGELTPNSQKKININNYSNNHDDHDNNNNNESDDGNNDDRINNNSNIIKIRYSLSVLLVLYLQHRDIHIW